MAADVRESAEFAFLGTTVKLSKAENGAYTNKVLARLNGAADPLAEAEKLSMNLVRNADTTAYFPAVKRVSFFKIAGLPIEVVSLSTIFLFINVFNIITGRSPCPKWWRLGL